MWLRAVGVLTPDSDGEILEELVAMEVGYQSVEICSMKLSLRSSGRWNLMRKSITEFMQLTKSARTYQQKRLYAYKNPIECKKIKCEHISIHCMPYTRFQCHREDVLACQVVVVALL